MNEYGPKDKKSSDRLFSLFYRNDTWSWFSSQIQFLGLPLCLLFLDYYSFWRYWWFCSRNGSLVCWSIIFSIIYFLTVLNSRLRECLYKYCENYVSRYRSIRVNSHIYTLLYLIIQSHQIVKSFIFINAS